MSLTLSLAEALGLVIKLLPQFKSLTGARRREYSDRLIEPLFHDLEKVHAAYETLFLTTKEAAIDLDAKSDSLEPEQQRERLAAIVEEFRRLRQADESLRDTVRRLAQDSLAAIKWKEERHFYLAVGHYFLRAQSTPEDNEHLDVEAQRLIASGGREVWPTPSSAVYAQLRRAGTTAEVVTLLESERRDLIDRWTQIASRHSAVVRALVMET